MKNLSTFIYCILAAIVISPGLAQDQLFFIHEDDVLPSKSVQYNNTSAEFAKVLREQNIPELAAFAHMQEGYHYLWVTPIENFAALDENPWSKLEEKIGKEAFDALFAGYDGTYTAHRSYFVKYRDENSYVPEGGDWDDETTYRRWDYNWVNPDMAEEATAISKEWAELHKSKGAPHGYRVYTGGIGTDVPLIIVFRWAKGPAEMVAQMAENSEVLGEEAAALWARTASMLTKTDSKSGWYLPDISYVPPPPEEQ